MYEARRVGSGTLLAVIAAWLLTSTEARAEAPSFDAGSEAPAPERVPLELDVEGPVRVVAADGTTLRCHGRCSVTVEPGAVTVHTDTASKELLVEGPSRVYATRGLPVLRTAGAGLLIGGAAIVIASVVIPLVACRNTREVDAFGRVIDHDPCRDVSDGVKIVWIAGAGVGLTAALVGGITYATAGPSLRLARLEGAETRPAPSPAAARFELVPVLRTSRDVERGAAILGGGAMLALRVTGW